MQRTGASRFAQSLLEDQWRLAPAADADRWAAMRTVLLLAFLLLAGCHRQSSVESVRTVADMAGTNELVLCDSVTPWLLGNGKDHEFHSMVWRVRSGTNWIDKATISRSAFLAGTIRDRWVIDIGCLDITNGTAVIKVGENSLPVTNGSTVTINCSYSWREWNLLTNGEVRVLQVCKEPFEKLTR
jgi:type II secretory pathway component PulL